MSKKLSHKGRLHAGDPCYYCRRPMLSPSLLTKGQHNDVDLVGRTATIDHVRPRVLGGGNEVSNIVICCQRCNGLKGHLPYEIFFQFARVVIKQYPEASRTALVGALRQFIDSLAEIAIKNKVEARRALSLSLLRLSDEDPNIARGKRTARVKKGAK